MNEKQKALEHVRSVCPELMELSQGCRLYKGRRAVVVDTTDDGEHIKAYYEGAEVENALFSKQHFYDEGGQIIGHTPHLEHWLRGINHAYGVRPPVELHLGILLIGSRLEYNLTKDGNNQDESFYKAYNQIVGI
jgi:hypothetical protein